MLHRSLVRTAILAAFLLLVLQTVSAAGEKCQTFRAISQQTFDDSVGTYAGPTVAAMNSEVLIDTGVPARPAVRPPATTCQGGVCTDRDAQYLYDFGGGDTLTLEVQLAVYPEPPTFGIYRGTNKIVAGTGRFQNASGVIYESGPFFAWIDGDGKLQARYSGELSGEICNVEPKRPPRASGG